MVPRLLKPAASPSRAHVSTSAPLAVEMVEGRPMPMSMPSERTPDRRAGELVHYRHGGHGSPGWIRRAPTHMGREPAGSVGTVAAGGHTDRVSDAPAYRIWPPVALGVPPGGDGDHRECGRPDRADRGAVTTCGGRAHDGIRVVERLGVVAHGSSTWPGHRALRGVSPTGERSCGRGPAGRPGRDPIAGFEPDRPRRTVRGCGCWSGSLPSLTWAPRWPRRGPGEAGLRCSAAEPAWARHRSCGRSWPDSTQVSVSWKAPATIC